MPWVRTAAVTWGHKTLATQKEDLQALLAHLGDPTTATELHLAARKSEDAARGHELSDRVQEAMARGGRAPIPGSTSERLVRRRLAPAVAAQESVLLSRLFCHPRGVEIVWKFSDGAPRGQARARELVADSVEAIPKIDAKLADPDYVWHFAPAILAGVGVRGLADRPGFPEYAVQIGQVLSRSVVENVLDQLSTAVFACGLATGPAGLAVSGVLDVALSGATSAVVFLREREQDLAATATAFSAEDDRWAVPADVPGNRTRRSRRADLCEGPARGPGPRLAAHHAYATTARRAASRADAAQPLGPQSERPVARQRRPARGRCRRPRRRGTRHARRTGPSGRGSARHRRAG